MYQAEGKIVMTCVVSSFFLFEALAEENRGSPSTKIVMGLLGSELYVIVAANNVGCHSEECHLFVG
jgi:hypothetical protein